MPKAITTKPESTMRSRPRLSGSKSLSPWADYCGICGHTRSAHGEERKFYATKSRREVCLQCDDLDPGHTFKRREREEDLRAEPYNDQS